MSPGRPHRPADRDRSDGALAGAVLDERARHLARPRVEPPPAGGTHLLATVAGAKVAVPTERARGVVATRRLSRLPPSAVGIIGLTAVQGDLVPVADLSLLVSGEARGPVADGQLVLVDDRGSPLALQVDRVDGVVTLEGSGHRAGRIGAAATPGVVAGVAADGVLVLDVDALLADPRLWPPAGPAIGADPTEPDGGTIR